MSYDPESYWKDRYEAQGPHYVAKGGRAESYYRQVELISPLLECLPTSGRVLDYGCGPQRFRGALEAHGLDYDGFDIIPGLSTTDYVEKDAYDCAVALYVLQHITDDAEYRMAVEFLTGAVKEGGTILVIDHNVRDGMAEHMKPRGLDPIREWVADASVTSLDDDHWFGVFTR